MGFVSPGSYNKEIDLSLYAETASNTSCAMAHTFNKGPLDEVTLVTNFNYLVATFGLPIDDDDACQGWMAAREYLRRGNKLYIVRVDYNTTADYAAMSLPCATDETLASADDGVTSALAVRTLTSAGVNFTTSGVVAGDVVEIADVGTPADNGFYVITLVAAGVITVDRDWPNGGLNSLTFTVWVAKKESGLDGVTSIPTTRTLTSAGSTFTTNAVAEGDILRVHDDTPATLEDNGFYRITNVAMNVLTVDRDWPVGSKAALTFTVYGASSRSPTVADGSTAVAGEFTSAAAQFGLHGVDAGDILVICDPVDTGNNGAYYIERCKVGATAITLDVNVAAWPGGALAGLTFYVLPGSVIMKGATKGTWCTGYRLYPIVNNADTENFNLNVYDSTPSLIDTNYNMDRSSVVADMVANSAYFTATLIATRHEPCPGFGVIDSALGIYLALTGGNDGYDSIADSDYIIGLNRFLNPEQYVIDILICPGDQTNGTPENVANAMAVIAESRADCIAIIDPPDWATIDTVQEILDWHNGVGATVLGATARGSSYCCTYWTWQKTYDEFNSEDRWCAPSGHVAAEFTHSDNQAYPWIAPAGIKRGKLIGSADVRYSPSKDDRDSLYGSGQAVNAIVKFVGEGIYVYGQKTLYRTTTALNRVNVRRMLNYCKRAITNANRSLVFDPNDEVLWREVKQNADPVLKYVLSHRGIRDYKIVCDSTTTTDQEIENYTLVGKLLIMPQKAAEIIVLEFTLTSQGANFNELIMAA